MAVMTPTCKMYLFGHEMRFWRERAGLSQEHVGKEILGKSQNKINLLENGRGGIGADDRDLLLDAYLVPDTDRQLLVELSEGTSQRGRWKGVRETYPDHLRPYIDLESDAAKVRAVVSEMVHGLLQTPEYIRTIFEAYEGDLEHPLSAYVEARIQRQEALRQDDNGEPRVEIMLFESCLRRQIGSPAIMQRQLDHLAELHATGRALLRIVPFRTRVRNGVLPFISSATIFDLGMAGLRSEPLSVVHREGAETNHYTTEKSVCDSYTTKWQAMKAMAADGSDTLAYLEDIRRSHR